MNDLKSVNIACPYCGERINFEIDCSIERQSYVEDCHVCCRPVDFTVVVDQSGNPKVNVSRDDD